jgi:hypothetical protein
MYLSFFTTFFHFCRSHPSRSFQTVGILSTVDECFLLGFRLKTTRNASCAEVRTCHIRKISVVPLSRIVVKARKIGLLEFCPIITTVLLSDHVILSNTIMVMCQPNVSVLVPRYLLVMAYLEALSAETRASRTCIGHGPNIQLFVDAFV